MRSTKATYAVERLKTRSGNTRYAAVSLSGGLFYLIDRAADKDADKGVTRLCEPLPLDAFVAFVDGFGPPKPSKASKLDLAFEEQLRKSRS
jgi:hypothetical protein